MKITNLKVAKVEKENSRMKGLASITLDDCFVIDDIRIIDGDKGMFIAMPSRRLSDGSYKDIVHPINSETRKYFEETILTEFNKEV